VLTFTPIGGPGAMVSIPGALAFRGGTLHINAKLDALAPGVTYGLAITIGDIRIAIAGTTIRVS
jgi:hypothetical protein